MCVGRLLDHPHGPGWRVISAVPFGAMGAVIGWKIGLDVSDLRVLIGNVATVTGAEHIGADVGAVGAMGLCLTPSASRSAQRSLWRNPTTLSWTVLRPCQRDAAGVRVIS